MTWLEVAPKVAKVYEDAGPLTPIRVLVFPTLCCKFFISLLQQMLPDALYMVCPGIADFSQQYSAIHRDAQGLHKISMDAAVIKY